MMLWWILLACGGNTADNRRRLNDTSDTGPVDVDCPPSAIGLTASGTGWLRDPDNPIMLPGQALGDGTHTSLNVADPSVLFDPVWGLWRMWFANAYDESNDLADPSDTRLSVSSAATPMRHSSIAGIRTTRSDWQHRATGDRLRAFLPVPRPTVRRVWS